MSLRHGVRQALAFANGLRSYSIGSKKFLNLAVNDETGVTTVTMNRPPVNALNLDFLTELSETFSALEESKPAGVLITSFSDKVFSTGLDLNEILKPDHVRLKTFWTRLQDVMINLYGLSCVTVAVVSGHAPAGGCLISLSCDYRIMVKNLTIGLNEAQVGIAAPPWLILAMQNAIGKRNAELALTTAQLFSTNEALEIGLIDEIAATKADAMEKAMAFFKRYELIDPLARTLTKSYLRRPDIEIINKIREKDVENFVSLITMPDIQQNLQDYFLRIKSKK